MRSYEYEFLSHRADQLLQWLRYKPSLLLSNIIIFCVLILISLWIPFLYHLHTFIAYYASVAYEQSFYARFSRSYRQWSSAPPSIRYYSSSSYSCHGCNGRMCQQQMLWCRKLRKRPAVASRNWKNSWPFIVTFFPFESPTWSKSTRYWEQHFPCLRVRWRMTVFKSPFLLCSATATMSVFQRTKNDLRIFDSSHSKMLKNFKIC